MHIIFLVVAFHHALFPCENTKTGIQQSIKSAKIGKEGSKPVNPQCNQGFGMRGHDELRQ